MQQFVVPQFLDVEDKVIGPITVRQFVMLLISGGLIFLAYKVSDFTLFLLWLIVIAILTILFAFIKVNGRPVHYLLLNFLQTMKRPHLSVWDKHLTPAELQTAMSVLETKPLVPVRNKPLVGSSRLAELSLIVDTGGVYEGEEEA
ncbi:MAG: PrgI family protein [Patescibacteria group bacterium]|nr:PrgI family protein [Patescibacteria group bacterium]